MTEFFTGAVKHSPSGILCSPAHDTAGISLIEKCKSEKIDLINSIISSGKLDEENEKKLTSGKRRFKSPR